MSKGPKKPVSEFTLKVMDTIRSIPRGKVATYKQVAAITGKPHASRGVAWILNSCAKKYKLPWQRVLSSKGGIAFKSDTHAFRLQKSRLLREGVKVAADGRIDMSKYQWKKKARLKASRLQPRMFA